MKNVEVLTIYCMLTMDYNYRKKEFHATQQLCARVHECIKMKEICEFDESLDGHYKSYKLNDVNLLQLQILNVSCFEQIKNVI